MGVLLKGTSHKKRRNRYHEATMGFRVVAVRRPRFEGKLGTTGARVPFKGSIRVTIRATTGFRV